MSEVVEIAGAAISNKRRDEMWRKVLFRKSCEGESYEEEFREAETLPNDEERSEEDAKEKTLGIAQTRRSVCVA